MKRKIALLFVFLFLSVILMAEMLGITWSQEVKFTSCQPKELSYGSFEPYCFQVIKLKQPLHSRNIILISKKIEPNYGFVINFPTTDIIGKEELDGLQVQWQAEGLQIETIWKVRLFIPKEKFIGGR